MLKVGLTGGYASGKSFVAAELSSHGCHLIYADQLGHQTLQTNGEAYPAAIEIFGREILASDGTIDRKRLAAIVFNSPALLAQLNAVVHPAVFRLEERMLEDFREQDPQGIAVVEAAILVETGRYRFFDRLIVTTCSLETQIVRGMKRDGATRGEVLARLEKQLPMEDKTRQAHYLIDTGGTKEDTARQIEQVYFDLKRLAEATA
jgi:dephospho-CoA kinase